MDVGNEGRPVFSAEEAAQGRRLLDDLQRLGYVHITVDGAMTRDMPMDELARHDPTLPGRIMRYGPTLARVMEEASIALEREMRAGETRQQRRERERREQKGEPR